MTMFRDFLFQSMNYLIAIPLLCFLIFTNQNKAIQRLLITLKQD